MREAVTSGTLASPERRRAQTKGAGLIPANRTWRSRRWSRSSRFFLLWFPRAAQGCTPWRCGSEGRRPSAGEETAGGGLGLFVRSERPRGLAGSDWSSMSLRIPVAEAEQPLGQTALLPRPPPRRAQAGEPARHRCGDILARPPCGWALPEAWAAPACPGGAPQSLASGGPALLLLFLLLLPRPLCREALPGVGGSGVRVFVGRQGELIREGMTRARGELCRSPRGRQTGGRGCLQGK